MRNFEIFHVEGKNDKVTVTDDRITVKISSDGNLKNYLLEDIKMFMMNINNLIPIGKFTALRNSTKKFKDGVWYFRLYTGTTGIRTIRYSIQYSFIFNNIRQFAKRNHGI